MRPMQVNHHQAAVPYDIMVNEVSTGPEGRVKSLIEALEGLKANSIPARRAVGPNVGMDDSIPPI